VPRDIVVGVLILAFCAVAYWISLSIKQAPSALAQNVQPSTFPRLVIGVIAILTVVMMAIGFRRADRTRAGPALTVYLTAAMMIGFILVFQHLGILAAMATFAFCGPLLWGAKNYLAVLLFAILFPAAVYLLFAVILGVYFEPGIIETAIGKFL
jgi:putative tricarboxylic transport membrane protein